MCVWNKLGEKRLAGPLLSVTLALRLSSNDVETTMGERHPKKSSTLEEELPIRREGLPIIYLFLAQQVYRFVSSMML